MVRFSEWINLKDEEEANHKDYNKMPEAKAISTIFAVAMALPGSRRHAILKTIVTAATVASVQAVQDNGELTEASSGWSIKLLISNGGVQQTELMWYLILGLVIFLAGVAMGSRTARGSGEPRAKIKAKADQVEKTARNFEMIYVTEYGYHRSQKYHTSKECSRLRRARDYKIMYTCLECNCSK